ncbi:MAG: hypothetical protein GX567_10325, partial [Clostridia bacterium]|nr:hypothetical protein [Clostridia bacterium]
RGGIYYIIACILKTGHDYMDDWSHPGEVKVAKLPADLTAYGDQKFIEFEVLKTGLLKNHGYCRGRDTKGDYSIVASADGVYQFCPPDVGGGQWSVTKMIDEPTSDAALVDFDEDGQLEIITITPFHGDRIKVYKLINNKYMEVFVYEEPAEFAHAIWAGTVYGKPAAIIGHRKGKRDLLGITYENGYHVNVLDSDVGSANILRYESEGVEYLASANREINEIAFYEIER